MSIDLDKQIAGVRIVLRDVNDLIPYARNSKVHSDAQISLIAGSIREFGFTAPVLTDGANGILAGHGRVLAAQRLGLPRVPTIDLSHLTPTQRKAYVIADNRLAEKGATWDTDMLSMELGELHAEDFSLSLIGYDDADLAKLLGENEPPAEKPPEDFDTYGEDIATEHQCPSCGYRWSGKSAAAPRRPTDDTDAEE